MRSRDSIAGRDAKLVRAIVIASSTGCVVPVSQDQPPSAHDIYVQQAWPALGQCVGCHGSQPAIDFLAPGTPDGAYATIFAFQPPVVDLDSPAASLVLTMGKHTGPAMAPQNAATILEWIQRERDERTHPTDTPFVAGPVQPQLGASTTVDLGHGAQLAFTASAFDGKLELDQIQIATTTSAMHVVHPLFVSRPTGSAAVVDLADHFDDIDVVIPAGTAQPLSSATFLSFAATDPITIHFLDLEAK
jgi:hypothetical protein